MLVLGSPTFYARALPAAQREDLELIFVELRHFVPIEDGFDSAKIDFALYAEDIEALRQAAGVEPPIVLGKPRSSPTGSAASRAPKTPQLPTRNAWGNCAWSSTPGRRSLNRNGGKSAPTRSL